jgi:hypothetical protein
MNRRDAYNEGHTRGWNAASWIDMPEIGQSVPPDVDWIGINTVETVADQVDVFVMLCDTAETNSRDHTPFEAFASTINRSRDPENLWDAYDRGVQAGVQAYRRKYYPLRALRKAAKERSPT